MKIIELHSKEEKSPEIPTKIKKWKIQTNNVICQLFPWIPKVIISITEFAFLVRFVRCGISISNRRKNLHDNDVPPFTLQNKRNILFWGWKKLNFPNLLFMLQTQKNSNGSPPYFLWLNINLYVNETHT